MEELITRYIHFIGIMLLASMLVTQNVLIKSELSAEKLRQLAVIDGLYGLGAIVTLGAGLALWFWVGKPGVFYSKNFVFHIKLTLFVIIALLSIYPTVFFIKHRSTDAESTKLPGQLILIKRLELVLLAVLPLLAVLMARGIGLSE